MGVVFDARHVAMGGVLLAMFLGCSGAPSTWNTDGGTNDDGSTTNDDGGTTTNNDGGTTTKDSGTTQDSGTTTKDGGTTTQDSGITVDSGDGFSAARTACINEINKLRTQNGHAAYNLWTSGSIDQCVDEQATYDQAHNSAHSAWMNNVYPTCNGYGQDECLGYGISPSQVVACLDAMWNERNQPNCQGCDACNSTQLTQQVMACQNTSTCDFYGTNQPKYGECGHYVNMSANYFSYAACGFSTAGGSGQWAVQNFK
jgi:hypothetical protein